MTDTDTVKDLEEMEEEIIESPPTLPPVEFDPEIYNKFDKITEILEAEKEKNEQMKLEQEEAALKLEKEEAEKEKNEQMKTEQEQEEEDLKMKQEEQEFLEAFELWEEFESKEDALFYWQKMNFENHEANLLATEEFLLTMQNIEELLIEKEKIDVEGYYFISLAIIVSFAVKIFIDQITKW